MNLERLVYISTATRPLVSVSDVADIVRESARHNPANNVTGALAFTETRFIQLLEGSHGSLDVLILKLMIDTRHRDIIFIDRTPITARAFTDWALAAPVLTPAGEQRLAAFMDNPSRSADDFQALLREMVDEPMQPGRSPP